MTMDHGRRQALWPLWAFCLALLSATAAKAQPATDVQGPIRRVLGGTLIESKINSQCLTISEGGAKNGPVQVAPCPSGTGAPHARWRLIPSHQDTYTVRNAATGQCLNAGNSGADGLVQLMNCAAEGGTPGTAVTNPGQWKLLPSRDDTYLLRSAINGRCLIVGERGVPGGAVHFMDCQWGADKTVDVTNDQGRWRLSGMTGPARQLSQGVLAYFPFDANAEDLSGRDLHGRASEEVRYESGRFGHAASFRTPGAYVRLPLQRDLFLDAYTLSVWLYREPVGASPGLAETAVVVGPLHVVRATGKLRFRFEYERRRDSAEHQWFESQGVIPEGSWHHVMVVYTATSGELRIIMDGQVDSRHQAYKQPILSGPGGGRGAFLPGSFWIGGAPGGSGSKDLTLFGHADDVLLYSRALTPAEVEWLGRAEGRPPPATSRRSLLGASSDCHGDAPGPCGDTGQPPCWCCTQKSAWNPESWPICISEALTCNATLSQREGTCQAPPPPPEITVERLPERIDIPGAPLLRDVQGFQARITGLDGARFVVPDGRKEPASCQRLLAWSRVKCPPSNHTVACQELRGRAATCHTRRPVCGELGFTDNSTPPRPFHYALKTLQEWQQSYRFRLAVNANWFNIDGPANFPHVSACTEIFGYSVRDGARVSSESQPDIDGAGTLNLLDALVVFHERQPDHTLRQVVKIVRNADLSRYPNVRWAVGGFMIAQGGKALSNLPSSTKSARAMARTAAGLTADGQTLYFVVVQPGPLTTGGMLAKQLALYMINTLKVSDVINLDNSGSSQFYYSDGKSPPLMSKPGDIGHDGTLTHRPIPNFIGIE